MMLEILDVAPLAQEADLWIRWLEVAAKNANRTEDVLALRQMRQQLRDRVQAIVGVVAW